MKNLVERARRSESLLFIEDEAPHAKQDQGLLDRAKEVWNEHYWKIIIGFIVLAIVYFFIIRTGALTGAVMALNQKLDRLYQTHPGTVVLVLFLLVVSVECFCYFSHAAMCILVASILKNFWLSVFVLISSSLTGSALIFYLSHLFCREWILRKLEKNDFFQVLQEESHHSPYRTAFLTRLLFIPAGVKDYILTTIDNPAQSFFLSGFVVHLFYIVESCLVADQFEEIKDMFGHEKSWSQKTGIEKFSFIMVMSVLIFTIIFLVVLGKWATKRIKDRKMEMEIEMVNMRAQL